MTKHATTDSKGRLTLGSSFANRTVIVDVHDDGEIVLKLARIVPDREAWLHENKEAFASVQRGLKEAAAGEFSTKPPDLDAALKLSEQLRDE